MLLNRAASAGRAADRAFRFRLIPGATWRPRAGARRAIAAPWRPLAGGRGGGRAAHAPHATTTKAEQRGPSPRPLPLLPLLARLTPEALRAAQLAGRDAPHLLRVPVRRRCLAAHRRTTAQAPTGPSGLPALRRHRSRRTCIAQIHAPAT